MLKGLRLQPEALRALSLPVHVKAGYVGALTLKVPWANLGKEPVVLELDRIFCLVETLHQGTLVDSPEEAAKLERKAKTDRIEAAVKRWLEHTERKAEAAAGGAMGNKWVQTILGNLQLSITNVHVRFEESDSANPFATGVTCEELSAVTVDADNARTFVSQGALDLLRKRVTLRRFSVYFDTDAAPFEPAVAWAALPAEGWEAMFQPGIAEEGAAAAGAAAGAGGARAAGRAEHDYVLAPVNGELRYRRQGRAEGLREGEPQQDSHLLLDDVTASVSFAQYVCVQTLLGQFSLLSTRRPHLHLRPRRSVTSAPRAWWRYALEALVHHGWVRRNLAWGAVLAVTSARRRYVPEFVKQLRGAPHDAAALAAVEEAVHEKAVVMFRCMGHSQVREEERKLKETMATGWFGGGGFWGRAKSQGSAASDAESSDGELSDAEWDQLQTVFATEGAEIATSDSPFALEHRLQVGVGCLGLVIQDQGGRNILSGRVDGLEVELKKYPVTKSLGLTLGDYGITSPHTNIVESMQGDGKAISIALTLAPQDGSADTIVDMNVEPCFVVVTPEDISSLLAFVKSAQKGSSDDFMALGLKVAAKAQDVAQDVTSGIQTAIAEKKRVDLNMNVHGPKISVVPSIHARDAPTSLYLDLGLFTGRTIKPAEDAWLSEKGSGQPGQYETFVFSLQDVSIVTADTRKFRWAARGDCGLSPLLEQFQATAVLRSSSKAARERLPLQLMLSVPSIKAHAGPRVLHDVMHIASTFRKSLAPVQAAAPAPAEAAEIEGEAETMHWVGVGQTVVEWQPKRLAVYRAKLHVFDDGGGGAPAASISLWDKTVAPADPDIVGEAFALALLDRHGAVQLTFQLFTRAEAERWFRTLGAYIDQLRAITRQDSTGTAASSPRDGEAGAAGARDPAESSTVEVGVELKELELHLSGRHFVTDPDGRSACDGREGELVVLTARKTMLSFRSSAEGQVVTVGMKDVAVFDYLNDGHLLRGSAAGVRPPGAPDSTRAVHTPIFHDAYEDTAALRPVGDDLLGLEDLIRREAFLEENQWLISIACTALRDNEDVTVPNIAMGVKLRPVVVGFHRPTIGALMVVGQDISHALSTGAGNPDPPGAAAPSKPADGAGETTLRMVAQTTRPVLRFDLDIDQVELEMAYENPFADDFRSMARLRVEHFRLQYTSLSSATFQLKANLGNVVLEDAALDLGHPYRTPIGLRKTDGESLVNLEVASYSAVSGEYFGHDFHVACQIQAVRIVFLNRFFAELGEYLLCALELRPAPLVPPPLETVDGEPAGARQVKCKLQVSMDSPLIIVPKSTNQFDNVEVDLGHLELENDFATGSEGGVAYDIESTRVTVTQLQATVTLGGERRPPIVHQSKPISVEATRILNGESRRKASTEVLVDIPQLQAQLSQTEYDLVLKVASSNLKEPLRTPQRVVRRGAARGGPEGAATPSTPATAQKTSLFAVSLNQVELLFHKGNTRDKPILMLAVSKLWLDSRKFKDGSSRGSLHIPGIRLMDMREGTPENHRVVLSTSSSLHAQLPAHQAPLETPGRRQHMRTISSLNDEAEPSMLIVQWGLDAHTTDLSVQLQEPSIFIEFSFLFELIDFFVPALFSGKEDPFRSQAIVLSATEYRAGGDTYLSPLVQIFADSMEAETMVFDGNGHRLVLPEVGHKGDAVPYIIVGEHKTLVLRNVEVVPLAMLPRVVQLGAASNIVLESVADGKVTQRETVAAAEAEVAPVGPEPKRLKARVTATGIHSLFQHKDSSERLALHAGASIAYEATGDATDLELTVDGLELLAKSDADTSLETGEPFLKKCDVALTHRKASGKNEIDLRTSDINLTLSPGIFNMLLGLQGAVQESFSQPPLDQCFLRIARFRKLAAFTLERSEGQEAAEPNRVTFWRAVPPPGYCSVGDVVTNGDLQPSREVFVVAKSYGLVKNPRLFTLVWTTPHFSLWQPQPPEGYVAMGLVVSLGAGSVEPEVSSAFCVHKRLVVESHVGSQYLLRSGGSTCTLRAVRNISSTFLARECTLKAFALRPPACVLSQRQYDALQAADAFVSAEERRATGRREFREHRAALRAEAAAPQGGLDYVSHAVKFTQVWADHDARFGNGEGVSVWRPIPPAGYSMVGDCFVQGRTPPSHVLVLSNSMNNVVAHPVAFDLIWGDINSKKSVSIWRPVPPPGYFPVGFVMQTGTLPPSTKTIYCVRHGMTEPVNCPLTPAYFRAPTRSAKGLRVWEGDEFARTFVVISGAGEPVKSGVRVLGRLGAEADRGGAKEADEGTFATVSLGNISTLVCDSLSYPVLELSLLQVRASVNKLSDAVNLSSTFSPQILACNRKLHAWEPVLDYCEWYLKVTEQTSQDARECGEKARYLRLAGSTDVNVTLAQASIASILRLLSDFAIGVEQEGEKRATSVVVNELGTQVYVQVPGAASDCVELPKGTTQLELFPAVAPAPSQKHLELGREPQGTYRLQCHISEIQGLPSEWAGRKVSCYIGCENGSYAYRVKTKPVPVPHAGKLVVDEKLVLPFPGAMMETGNALTSRVAASRITFSVCDVMSLAGAEPVMIATGSVVLRDLLRDTDFYSQSSKTPIVCQMLDGAAGLEAAGGGASRSVQVVPSINLSDFLSGEDEEARTARQNAPAMISFSAAGPWVPLLEGNVTPARKGSKQSAVSVSPICIGSSGMIVESYLDLQGCKKNVLRSLVQLENASAFALDVVGRVAGRNTTRIFNVSHSETPGRDCVEIFENQVFSLATGWTYAKRVDKGTWAAYTDKYGRPQSMAEFPALPLPHGWEWTGGWQMSKHRYSDKEGWWYAGSFKSLKIPPLPGNETRGVTDTVRTRRFVRPCQRAAITDEEMAISFAEAGTEIPLGVLKPGEALSVPRQCCIADAGVALALRPHGPEAAARHGWSVPVAAPLLLGDLASGSTLTVCPPAADGAQPLWLALECEGFELPTAYGFETLTDWKVTVGPPLLVENKLCTPAMAGLWEKPKVVGASTSKVEQRQNVRVEPGATAGLHFADPRRTLGLSFVPKHWGLPPKRNIVQVTNDETEAARPVASHVLVQQNGEAVSLHLNYVRSSVGAWPLTIQVWSALTVVNATELPLHCYAVGGEGATRAGAANDAEHTIRMRNLKGTLTTQDRAQRDQAKFVAPAASTFVERSLLFGESESDDQSLQVFVGDARPLLTTIPLKPVSTPYLIVADAPDLGLTHEIVGEVGIGSTFGSVAVTFHARFTASNLSRLPVVVSTLQGEGGSGQRSLVPQLDTPLRPGDRHKQLQWPRGASEKCLRLAHESYGASPLFPLALVGGEALVVPLFAGETCMWTAEVSLSVHRAGCAEVVIASVDPVMVNPPVKFFNFSAEEVRVGQKTKGERIAWWRIAKLACSPFAWVDYTEDVLEVAIAADGVEPISVVLQDGVQALAEGEGDDLGAALTGGMSLKEGMRCSFHMRSGWHELTMALVGHTVHVTLLPQAPALRSLARVPLLQQTLFFTLEAVSVSLVDGKAEEMLLASVEGLELHVQLLGDVDTAKIARFRLNHLQIDDMNMTSQFPVVLPMVQQARGAAGKGAAPTLALDIHSATGAASSGRLDLPFLSLVVPYTQTFELHEPLLWRLVLFFQSLSQETAPAPGAEGPAEETIATLDPLLQISLLYIASISTRLSFKAEPASRPSSVGVLKHMYMNLVSIDGMPLTLLKQWEVHGLSVKQSRFTQAIKERVVRDVVGQLVNVFRGISVTGAAAGALGTLSDAAAALSMDGEFARSRARSNAAPVDGFLEGVAEGGLAFGKGIASGVSGLFLKPFEGLKDKGAKGLVEGVGKGVVGLAAQPLSGALEFVSKGVEGASAALDLDKDQDRRYRLPRAAYGDMVVRPFDPHAAEGYQMLKNAMWGKVFGGAHDLVREKGRYAAERYEFHYDLNDRSAVVVSNRKVIMLARPRRGGKACSVVWEAEISNVLTVDFTGGDLHNPPNQAVLVLTNLSRKNQLLKARRMHRFVAFPRGSELVSAFAEQLLRVRDRNRALGDRTDAAALAATPSSVSRKGSVSRTFSRTSSASNLEPADLEKLVTPCTGFHGIWSSEPDKKKGRYVSVWRPSCPPGYVSLGDVLNLVPDPPAERVSVIKDEDGYTALPEKYTLVWRDAALSRNSGSITVWRPEAPEGFAALGCVVVAGSYEPAREMIRCIRVDLLFGCNIFDAPTWQATSKDRLKMPVSFWQVDNLAGTFLASKGHSKVEDGAYDLLI